MRLITFDGLSASGKWTFNCKLCEHLGIERVEFNCFNTIVNIVDSNGQLATDLVLRTLIWMTAIRYSYQFDWQKRDIFIIGGFWRLLIETYAWDYYDEIDVLFDAVDTLITTKRDSILPICSFYMDISSYEGKVREAKRGLANEDIVATSDLNIEGISEPSHYIEQDKRIQEAINLLADRYPFFHIIDAMRPEEEVFNEIVNITEEALCAIQE